MSPNQGTNSTRRTDVEPDIFQHAPLDHSIQSLRVIQICSDLAEDGSLQCTISHATINHPFTCLSYCWGPATVTRQILLNGKPFLVRRNLYDFLEMQQRTQATPDVYWIDALCIDQTNTAERNHQVAQMGAIFSSALGVQIWLGKNEALVPIFQHMKNPDTITDKEMTVVRSYSDRLQAFICENDYFNRAWICQEIFLAQNVIIWLDREMFLFEHLHWTLEYFYLKWRDRPISQYKLFLGKDPAPLRKTELFKSARTLYQDINLLQLLINFRGKKCEIPRDRIFSLVSLAGFGKDIRIDYGSTDVDVAINVLRCCRTSMCVCTPLLLAQCLEVEDIFTQLDIADERGAPVFEVHSQGWTVCHDIIPFPLPRHPMPPEWYRGPQVFQIQSKYYEVRIFRKEPRPDEDPEQCAIIDSLESWLKTLRLVREIDQSRYEYLVEAFGADDSQVRKIQNFSEITFVDYFWAEELCDEKFLKTWIPIDGFSVQHHPDSDYVWVQGVYDENYSRPRMTKQVPIDDELCTRFQYGGGLDFRLTLDHLRRISTQGSLHREAKPCKTLLLEPGISVTQSRATTKAIFETCPGSMSFDRLNRFEEPEAYIERVIGASQTYHNALPLGICDKVKMMGTVTIEEFQNIEDVQEVQPQSSQTLSNRAVVMRKRNLPHVQRTNFTLQSFKPPRKRRRVNE